MRIVCPACAAVYQVPESLLGAEPRPLRCARCGNEWVPDPSSEPAPLPPPSIAERAGERETTLAAALSEARFAEQEPGAPPASPARVPLAPPPPADAPLAVFPPLVGRARPRSRRAVAGIGWTVSLLLLAALLAGAYLWRAQVQAAWPPSQRAYAALGLR